MGIVKKKSYMNKSEQSVIFRRTPFAMKIVCIVNNR